MATETSDNATADAPKTLAEIQAWCEQLEQRLAKCERLFGRMLNQDTSDGEASK